MTAIRARVFEVPKKAATEPVPLGISVVVGPDFRKGEGGKKRQPDACKKESQITRGDHVERRAQPKHAYRVGTFRPNDHSCERYRCPPVAPTDAEVNKEYRCEAYPRQTAAKRVENFEERSARRRRDRVRPMPAQECLLYGHQV